MSGRPFTVTSGVDNARTGTGGQLADQIGDPELLDDDRSRERHRAVVQHVRVHRQRPRHVRQRRPQLAARPGLRTSTSGLHKTFPITRLFARSSALEAFNVLNRVNLGIPSADRTSPASAASRPQPIHGSCSSRSGLVLAGFGVTVQRRPSLPLSARRRCTVLERSSLHALGRRSAPHPAPQPAHPCTVHEPCTRAPGTVHPQ